MTQSEKTGVLEVAHHSGYGQLNGTAIMDSETDYIVAVALGDVPELDAPATAAGLVRRWNAHPELVAALRWALPLVEDLFARTGALNDEQSELLTAKAVLASVEPQP